MQIDPDLETFHRALAAIPMFRAVRWHPSTSVPGGVELELTTAQGSHRFVVRRHPLALSSAAADRILAEAGNSVPPGAGIVLAEHVPPAAGARLGHAGWNFLDAVGNCRIALDDAYFYAVEGRRPRPRGQSWTQAAREAVVLFALLAEPHLERANVAELAARAHLAEARVRTLVRRLQAHGPGRREAVRQWLAAYQGSVRGLLTLGTFRPRDTHPDALEPLLQQALQGRQWAFGGGWAANLMTGYYRGPLCVVHVDEIPADLPRIVRALPDPRGPLCFVRPPSPIGYEGVVEFAAHPLLVYSELMSGESDRAHEAADEVASAYLHLAA
jgi:hypothetical protein